MYDRTELKERAAKAATKQGAIGPDIDLGQFETAPVPHAYLSDAKLRKLPKEEQHRLIMAGVDVTEKGRSGTYYQKDTAVVHCKSKQEGIEVLPIRQALEK